MKMIGERIKTERESKGISRYRLSKDTGIPYTTLADVERGKVKDIKFENLNAIAKALGVLITTFLEVSNG